MHAKRVRILEDLETLSNTMLIIFTAATSH